MKHWLLHHLLLLAALVSLAAGCSVPPPRQPPKTEERAAVQATREVQVEAQIPAPEPTPAKQAEPPPQSMPSRRAFAHVMVSFRNREVSGTWDGWNYSAARAKHNPDRTDSHGRRDIASALYPSLGAYDMLDTDLIETHCRLAAAAELDGFFFDVALGPDDEWKGESVRRYVAAMQRHGLQGAIVYEDKGHWIWDPSCTTREEAVAKSVRDLDAWLRVLDPVQVRIDGRPLVGFFSYEDALPQKGVSRLLPDELRAWKERFPAASRPVLVSSWFKPEYRGVIDGPYDWIWLNGRASTDGLYRTYMTAEDLRRTQVDREKQVAAWEKEGLISLHIGGVWPGFDSIGCWGFGGGPAYAPRDHGATYRYQWERVLASDVSIVQVVTWNDWFEATAIEPSLEYGTAYLEMTRDFVSRWKHRPASTNRFVDILRSAGVR